MIASMNIAVIGAGKVGGALGRLWLASGHNITFGLRDPQLAKRPIPEGAKTATLGEAAKSAHTILLSVPWPAAQQVVSELGDDLNGKILIDCTNPVTADLSSLSLGLTTSAGELIAGWAPKARIVKAFSTIGAQSLGNADFKGQRADGFYCGDDAEAKSFVKQLVESAGLEPVDVGPLLKARLLEPLAMLWIDLAYNQKQGPNHAFKLLRR